MSRRNRSNGQREHGLTAIDIFKEKRYVIIVLAIIITLIGGLFLHFQWRRYQVSAASEAINLAQSVEALLHTEHIMELSGSLDDLDKTDYNSTKSSLMRLSEISNAIRFAYIYGEKDGQITFLVDSEPPDSEDYSPPGQIYVEATDSTWKPLLTGEMVLTEPETDRWGTWISVLVPIKDSIHGVSFAVFGIDYDAAAWYAKVWARMISDFIIIAIFLLLSATILHIWIHHQMYKNLSQKLELDEALYHSIFEQAPIGIAVVNNNIIASQLQMGDVSINPMFTKILQRSNQELQNIAWSDITHPDDLQSDMVQFNRFQKGEISGYVMEKRYIRPNGSIIWTNMKISPLVGIPFQNTMHLCLLEDISARKEVEASLKESERSKSVLVSNLPGLAYRCDYDDNWTMRFVSDGCFELTGYSANMLIKNRDISFNDIIAPEYHEKLQNEWAQVLPKKLPLKSEYEIVTADGCRKWVLEMGEGVYNEQGEVEALEGIILDITDRKKSEEEIQKMLRRTQSMINNHQAIMLLIEPMSGRIIEANKAATEFYGYSNEELLQMNIQDINMMDSEQIYMMRLKVLEQGQKYFTFPHRLKSGETRIVDVYSSPIDYDDRKVLFSIIFDVTERAEIAKQNEYLAYHDYLTGLYNRRHYEEEFQRQVERNDFPIGIFLGDVDGFKVYNDTYGHSEGDKVLRKIAENLRTLVGHDGTLARVGGDEFSIIVSGKHKLEMQRYLDKLNHEYDNAPNDSTMDEQPTISWGYALQRKKDDTLDSLEEEAEAFMYNRKFYSHHSLRSKTVNTIMETLFTKSEREKNHSERVGLLSEAIAKHMHLSNEAIDKIRVAGFLHDIGKIGIDEAILNKPGKLDANEWEIMKLHPAKSAGILNKTHEYQEISDIVLSHHERYDGHGYPGKLQAEAIPLAARIIAVADTYDAITNDRPYKKALNRSAAITELKKIAGTQLDPEIVSIFIDNVLGESEEDIL
jgi:diguanylate cyclase (GGDEF)-like protein/PAS domain S-box-containing protein